MQADKSLFASFSSEKEDSYFLISSKNSPVVRCRQYPLTARSVLSCRSCV
jgi:hypothetical protein